MIGYITKNKETYLGKEKANRYKKLIILGVTLISMFTIVGCSSVSNSNVDSTDSSKSVSSSNKESSNSNKKGNNNESKIQEASKSSENIIPGIEIIKSEISDKAKFYPYESNGVKMEVLALKANDGTIRVAFNTCQVCYSSGKGYYVQEGKELVCQNCGNRFNADMVGKTKGGCNPVPIAEQSKVDDGTKIEIDKKFLDKNKGYFSNWKA
ncbi:DUF2318 domain-containing protein [Clostridium sp. C2-6-12]|uniref:DUF2318 domain-containing protein n=1 Tax=Clostridium sp. C2-6-12 TaxID=2698832 RepID=UPI001FAC8A9F|nr:DUF2318 domain-containing protein [Clostridium sp. C2-6-12]